MSGRAWLVGFNYFVKLKRLFSNLVWIVIVCSNCLTFLLKICVETIKLNVNLVFSYCSYGSPVVTTDMQNCYPNRVTCTHVVATQRGNCCGEEAASENRTWVPCLCVHIIERRLWLSVETLREAFHTANCYWPILWLINKKSDPERLRRRLRADDSQTFQQGNFKASIEGRERWQATRILISSEQNTATDSLSLPVSKAKPDIYLGGGGDCGGLNCFSAWSPDCIALQL